MAFLFPGQGSQSAGMLAWLPETLIVRQMLAEAATVLGYPPSQLDQENALKNTEYAQVAIFITGLASARMLRERGLSPSFLAGHSLGAFTAATFAGVINFADGLRLVRTRARAMQEACPDGYGMAAITGLTQSMCESLVSQVRAGGSAVYLGSVNSAEQVTISGSTKGLVEVLELARNNGARKTVYLDIPVPSHTPFMDGVAKQLLEAMREVRPQRPSIPCICNRAPRMLTDGAAILEDLARSVNEPIRWGDATALLYEAGVRTFIEMPPGNVLTSLLSKSFSDVRCLALGATRTESLDAVVPALTKCNYDNEPGCF
jgi:malonate decarboxylase epsilon subunit